MPKRESFYAIMANSDTIEGRGHSFFTGIGFRTKGDAVAFVKSPTYANKWGVGGQPGTEFDVQEINITIFYDLTQAEVLLPLHFKEQRKLKAMSKLSQEDREALGL